MLAISSWESGSCARWLGKGSRMRRLSVASGRFTCGLVRRGQGMPKCRAVKEKNSERSVLAETSDAYSCGLLTPIHTHAQSHPHAHRQHAHKRRT
jgi:hypothetical protein